MQILHSFSTYFALSKYILYDHSGPTNSYAKAPCGKIRNCIITSCSFQLEAAEDLYFNWPYWPMAFLNLVDPSTSSCPCITGKHPLPANVCFSVCFSLINSPPRPGNRCSCWLWRSPTFTSIVSGRGCPNPGLGGAATSDPTSHWPLATLEDFGI